MLPALADTDAGGEMVWGTEAVGSMLVGWMTQACMLRGQVHT